MRMSDNHSQKDAIRKKDAAKRVRGLSTEELVARNDLVLALPERIQAIPNGFAPLKNPSIHFLCSNSLPGTISMNLAYFPSVNIDWFSLLACFLIVSIDQFSLLACFSSVNII